MGGIWVGEEEGVFKVRALRMQGGMWGIGSHRVVLTKEGFSVGRDMEGRRRVRCGVGRLGLLDFFIYNSFLRFNL